MSIGPPDLRGPCWSPVRPGPVPRSGACPSGRRRSRREVCGQSLVGRKGLGRDAPGAPPMAQAVFPAGILKSMLAEVDIGVQGGCGFCRSREGRRGPAEMNCLAAVFSSCSAQVGAVVESRGRGFAGWHRRRLVRPARRRLPRLHHGPGSRDAQHHTRLPPRHRRSPPHHPLRSAGGHRRYSRYQLRIAARARQLVDGGTPIEAACRIVILEDQLEEARRVTAEHRRDAKPSGTPTSA